MRLITRGGYNWSKRYRWIVESALKNRYKQFVIDGEAVILGVDGISDFNALHSGEHNDEVQLYAFDILALDGDDLRSLPLSMRKAHLEPALSGLQELLRPAVIHRGGNAFPAAQLRDVLLAAQSFQHNAGLLFGRIRVVRRMSRTSFSGVKGTRQPLRKVIEGTPTSGLMPGQMPVLAHQPTRQIGVHGVTAVETDFYLIFAPWRLR